METSDNLTPAPLPAIPATPPPAASAAEPVGTRALFHQLLSQPLAPIHRAQQERGAGSDFKLLLGGLAGFALYGAAAGLFQGGGQILVAAWKAPAIALLSLLLCSPSLYVFGALAGARWTPATFRATAAALLATLGLLLAGLLPIAWLFSASSRFLATVTWIHVLLWLIALGLAFRFLGGALKALGSRQGGFLWLCLFAVVSFQVATLLRPVLWRPAGAPALRLGEKKSFFENLGDVFDVPAIDAKADGKKPAAKTGEAAKPAPAGPEKAPAPAPAASEPPEPQPARRP